jgi:hypothetical protein
MSPPGWSARGDSNPDPHGLNVPRLPIAPPADDGGDHGRIRTATGQALDLLPLPGWATWPLVPPGGLEPPLHGLRARRAAFTLRRELELIPGIEPGRRPYQGRRLPLHQTSLERMAGFEPAPQGLEGPQATVTPHSLWFGLRVTIPSLRAGSAGCILHTQAERGPVSLTGPLIFHELSKTPPLRAHRLVPPVWRQRQDSDPDPRALEARMLPLHHAVDVASPLDGLEDKTSLRPDAVFCRVSGQNKKGLPGDRPGRPGSP